ncbi:TIR domain-containing protein [Paenibacillus sp. NPDC055715]
MVNIFLGSANTPSALDDLRKIAELIEEVGHGVVPWTSPGVFLLGNHMSESLDNICKHVDAAILIFSEDNQVLFAMSLICTLSLMSFMSMVYLKAI